jgi:hypothetical protein
MGVLAMNEERTLLHAIKEAEEEERPCEHCDGRGYVDTMDTVFPGEPHQANVGTRPCICQMKEEEYDDQE